MRRLVVLAAVATLVVAAVSAEAAPPGFRYGVAAGEITSKSAVVWTRAPVRGAVCLFFKPRSVPSRCVSGQARPQNDLVVQVRLDGLIPGARYVYFFTQGARESAAGTFTTPPVPAANATARFAISGDADATPGANGKPGFNRFEIYARMAAEKNDFNINLGDTIYSDSEVGGAPVARTVAQKWGKYKLGLALPALRTLRASAGLYSHW
ncbi:MAG TPA: PhoD-like phosphatase N-terminal domain-containing protein, partial [Gaiellaceae bacterium]|nr:PhoD-like phosphatase N-terminal domain-containing protein [Gaiellaceae bacterium]